MKKLLISLSVIVVISVGAVLGLFFAYPKITNADILAVFPDAKGLVQEGLLEITKNDPNYSQKFDNVYVLSNGNMVFTSEVSVSGFEGKLKVVLGAKDGVWHNIKISGVDFGEKNELYDAAIENFKGSQTITLSAITSSTKKDNFYQVQMPEGMEFVYSRGSYSGEDAPFINAILGVLNNCNTYYECYSQIKDSKVESFKEINISNDYSVTEAKYGEVKAVYKKGNLYIIRCSTSANRTPSLTQDGENYELNFSNPNVTADMLVTVNVKTNRIVKVNYFYYLNSSTYGYGLFSMLNQYKNQPTTKLFAAHSGYLTADFKDANIDGIAGATGSANVQATAVNNALAYYNTFIKGGN